MKIDVERMEKDVVMGADFNADNPKILVIESTFPCTDIPNYDPWESIVLGEGYQFVYSRGNNRYYVSDEGPELKDRFKPWPEIISN